MPPEPEPINIVYDQVEPCWQPISNLAHAPFIMDGRTYASVEGFWQGLKFDQAEDRTRVAALSGMAAKKAAAGVAERSSFAYEGATYVAGGPGHHDLMYRACVAKFNQDTTARTALLATGHRPLMHRMPHDSKNIPGDVMADIWTRIRAHLQTG